MNSFETLIFYRGVSSENPIDKPYLKTPRKDRRPKNSPNNFHLFADKWFKEKFGIAYRSQGLFVTSKILTASSYAESKDHIVRVIPTSPYSYCWSPKLSDLLFLAKDMANSSEVEIHACLEKMQYCEEGLDLAHQSGHEVMIFCNEYISIPAGLSESSKIKIPKIILPTFF